MSRIYDLDAVVAAHRASANGGSWFRLSDMEYDAIVGAALRDTSESNAPKVNEKWRFRNGRGAGTFIVTRVRGDRVTLRSTYFAKDKTISLRTLRGDYERVT